MAENKKSALDLAKEDLAAELGICKTVDVPQYVEVNRRLAFIQYFVSVLENSLNNEINPARKATLEYAIYDWDQYSKGIIDTVNILMNEKGIKTPDSQKAEIIKDFEREYADNNEKLDFNITFDEANNLEVSFKK